MEQTITCSIVGLTEEAAQQQLIEKLGAMPGVTQVAVSGTEGRVSVRGEDLNPAVLTQAIEQSGIQVTQVQ